MASQHGLSRLGDKDHPIRMSSLTAMARCQMMFALRYLKETDEGSSEAASTGTAVQRQNELWHRGLDPEEATKQALAEAGVDATLDPDHLLRVMMGYSSDPRNAQTGMPTDPRYGEVVTSALEMEVGLVLPSASGDIHMTGHVDFIRRYPDGRLYLWDGKHSKHDTKILLWEYEYQIAAYTIAAAATMGEPVYPGGILATRQYDKGPRARTEAKPFAESPKSLDDCKRMVYDFLPPMIEQIRSGLPLVQPGQHCDPNTWRCHGGSQACLAVFDGLMRGSGGTEGLPGTFFVGD